MINPYRILYCRKCEWQYPGNAHAIGLKNECPYCLHHGLDFISGDRNDPEDWKRLSSKIRVWEELVQARTFKISGYKTLSSD